MKRPTSTPPVDRSADRFAADEPQAGDSTTGGSPSDPLERATRAYRALRYSGPDFDPPSLGEPAGGRPWLEPRWVAGGILLTLSATAIIVVFSALWRPAPERPRTAATSSNRGVPREAAAVEPQASEAPAPQLASAEPPAAVVPIELHRPRSPAVVRENEAPRSQRRPPSTPQESASAPSLRTVREELQRLRSRASTLKPAGRFDGGLQLPPRPAPRLTPRTAPELPAFAGEAAE